MTFAGRKIFGCKKGFVSFLELLLVVVVIAFIAMALSKRYLQKPVMDAETKKTLTQQGFNLSTQHSALESAKDKVRGIEQKMLEREDEIFKEIETYKR